MTIAPTIVSAIKQWLALLLLSAAAFALLELGRMPAAMLIGSMLAGIVVGVRGGTIKVPHLGFACSQAVVGCLIASSLSPTMFSVFAQNWMLFTGAVLATVAASSTLGWLISRWNVLPGSVGIWGSAPGAATAMVLMAGAFGADTRLVAFMQYLRVIIVSVGAALLAGLWIKTSGTDVPDAVWFPPLAPLAFGTTMAIAAVGAAAGWLLRLPSPYFLGALIVGTIAHAFLGFEFHLPHWLTMLCFAAIGWTIGLQFRLETLRHALRALPQIVLSILALMAFCGGIAFFLAYEMGIDPLTAYLATSPGGMDTVAIIAAASQTVDISFIMTMQALRFLFVLIAGPPLARLIASRTVPR